MSLLKKFDALKAKATAKADQIKSNLKMLSEKAEKIAEAAQNAAEQTKSLIQETKQQVKQTLAFRSKRSRKASRKA